MMEVPTLNYYLLIFVILLSAKSSCAKSPYLQIYPNVSTGNGAKQLYFGLMQSFGGGYDGRGIVPGVQVALDQINADDSILRGYTLHYTLSDSKVS